MKNLLLFSVRKVMQGTYLCGVTSCSEQLAWVGMWFLKLSTPLMVVVGLVALLCPFILVQIARVVAETFHPTHHSFGGYYKNVPYQPPYEMQRHFYTPTYHPLTIEDVKKGV